MIRRLYTLYEIYEKIVFLFTDGPDGPSRAAEWASNNLPTCECVTASNGSVLILIREPE